MITARYCNRLPKLRILRSSRVLITFLPFAKQARHRPESRGVRKKRAGRARERKGTYASHTIHKCRLDSGLGALAPPETFLNRRSSPGNRISSAGSARLTRANRGAGSRRSSSAGRSAALWRGNHTRRRSYEVPEVRAVRETAVTDLDDRLAGETAYSRTDAR